MIYAKRAGHLLERLANPDDQSQAPEGVLLYSPNLLRLVAVCAYGVFVLGFLNNFFVSDFFSTWFSDEKMTRLFYGQVTLVVLGAIGTGSVVAFAKSHYRGCMLGATMLAISSSMVICTYMYGLDINPHLLVIITPLLLVGFTVGRNGLALSAAWIAANYGFLLFADSWGWWPHPATLSIDVIKHENLSAFIILVLIVLSTQFYLVKISLTLRKQNELHREVAARQQAQLDLLKRVVTSKDDERKRIARDIHDAPLQELAAISRSLTEIREDVEDMLATCEELILFSNGRSADDLPPGTTHMVPLVNEWHSQLSRILGEDLNTEQGRNPPSISALSASSSHFRQESSPNIESAINQVRSTSQRLREICNGLHPTFLDDPLTTTLRTSVKSMQARNPNVFITLTTFGIEPTYIADEMKITFKHVVEEAITNALKHASPRRIHVGLSYAPDRTLTLEVADDGTGLEPYMPRELSAAGHHGLVNMHERAELIGGELILDADVSKGTCIKLVVSPTATQII